MLIPILKGTVELLESVENGEVIPNGCPGCESDLQLKQFRAWGTVFFVPMIPTKDTRYIYKCIDCGSNYDPAYRETFINRGRYLNASPKEIKELANAFSLTIFASVLKADNRPTDSVADILKDFAISCRISLETNQEKFTQAFLEQPNLGEQVIEGYGIFRDCFIEDVKNKPLFQVIKYSNLIELTYKESQTLYTWGRHWGLSRQEFDAMLQSS